VLNSFAVQRMRERACSGASYVCATPLLLFGTARPAALQAHASQSEGPHRAAFYAAARPGGTAAQARSLSRPVYVGRQHVKHQSVTSVPSQPGWHAARRPACLRGELTGACTTGTPHPAAVAGAERPARPLLCVNAAMRCAVPRTARATMWPFADPQRLAARGNCMCLPTQLSSASRRVARVVGLPASCPGMTLELVDTHKCVRQCTAHVLLCCAWLLMSGESVHNVHALCALHMTDELRRNICCSSCARCADMGSPYVRKGRDPVCASLWANMLS